MALSKLGLVSLLLEDLRIREKALRTLQYSSLFLSTVIGSKRKPFLNLFTQFGSARLVLRLLDTFAMVQYARNYGWGNHEKDAILRCLHLISNLVDTLYFPIEHIVFYQCIGMLSTKSDMPSRIILILWTISLISSILRSLYQGFKSWNMLSAEEMEKRSPVYKQYCSEVLNITMCTSDLLNSLEWLHIRPFHYPLSDRKIATFGLISSVIGLLRLCSLDTF